MASAASSAGNAITSGAASGTISTTGSTGFTSLRMWRMYLASVSESISSAPAGTRLPFRQKAATASYFFMELSFVSR